MAHLALTLMGPFEALLDGQMATGFQSVKVRALLAFLAVEMGRPHAREKLAGLLWPNVPDDCAHHSLNQALSSLRRAIHDDAAIPPFLIVSRQCVQFNRSSSYWLDVEAFEGLVGWRGDRLAGWEGNGSLNGECAGQAVAMYRGSFLEGLSVVDSPAFEEWALVQQERLHRLALEAMQQLAEACAVRGDVAQALYYARRQLELDPWLEEAHVQVMHLLALAGRRSEALAQYSICRQLLARELAVEPAASTTRLFQLIRDGNTTDWWQPVSGRPYAPTPPQQPLHPV